MSYPVPENEAQRLQALESYDILDSAPERVYDDLCHLASKVCGTKIAAVTFIDEDRQWIKAANGFEAGETSREDAFCAHAICNPEETMIVQDATQDERFRDNPFVEEDPNIRFYAGAPLRTPDGRGLGTICAIDDEPRELTAEQQRGLEALGRMAMTQLELRRRGKQVQETKQELETVNEELSRSNQELDRFASVVSHELKDPLSHVVSYLDLLDLTESDALSPEGQEYLDEAIQGGDRMEEMIQDLLRYSRAGRGGGEVQPVDLNGLVERVQRELRRRIEETGSELSVGSLPTVPGDPSMLRHVLQNLIGNAIKYSDGNPRIEIRYQEREDHVRVEIEDDGIGIPKDEQDALFDIFQRCSNTGDRSGTGVGLALAHRIVTRHGGAMGVESTVGEGSTFWFTLPTDVDEMPEPQA